MKDWIGNTKSVHSVLGASNHSIEQRAELDYYATDPKAVEKLLSVETFNPYVWECAAGEGHISKVLKEHHYNVKESDIVKRNYDLEIMDFLKYIPQKVRNDKDIITNPPYKYATEFVEHALDISMESVKVAMLLKIQFLESKKRQELFKKYPPKKIYVFTERINCAKNGKFDGTSSAVCYAWFVWEKGYKGSPQIDWI